MKKISLVLLLASMISSCGLQVRDNPTFLTNNPNTNGNPNTVAFTVGGQASGIPERKEIVLSINGNNYTIDSNGTFTFPQHFENEDAYDVDIEESDLGGAYTCSLQNDVGHIPNANVTNVLLTCTCDVNSLGVGTGTTVDPILVYTSQQLNQFAINETVATLAKHYKQVCDLDYTGIDPTPIGAQGASFTGSYDGNGYFILHYTSDQTDVTKTRRKGLFSWTNGALLKNINLVDFSLTANVGQGNGTNPARMGALVGTAIGTAIENVYADGVELDDNGQTFFGLGGLIGDQLAPICVTAYLKKVHVENVNINGENSENVGGVVGWTQIDSTKIEANDISISDCSKRCGGFAGNVESNAELKDVNVQDALVNGDQKAGGIVGENNGVLDRTSFIGTVNGVTSTGNFGGLVGFSTCNQPIKNSYTVSDVLSVGGSIDVGRVYGNQASITNVAYDNTQTCQNCSANPGTLSRSGSSSFIDGTDSVMASWNFSTTWCLVDANFPRLAEVPFSACE